MGLIVDKEGGIDTVGGLIEALQKFPKDMPLDVGMNSAVIVYRVEPQRGECVEDKRGRVCIEGDSGLF